MKIIYKAVDGSLFDDIEQCRSYEDALSFEPIAPDLHKVGPFLTGRLLEVARRLDAGEEVRVNLQDKLFKMVPVRGPSAYNLVGDLKVLDRDTIWRHILFTPNLAVQVKKRDGANHED